jgi:uncharacterized protein involved in cysteine biosynthesis
MNTPWGGNAAMPDPAETETAQRRKVEFATTFDTLIQSNLALTESVGRLVRLSWSIVVLNLVLIGVVILTLTWATLSNRQPRSLTVDVHEEPRAH